MPHKKTRQLRRRSVLATRRRSVLERLESRLMMAVDFGDAPAPYAVTLAENGARHEAVGPQLGATRDTEANGAHSAAANSDGADEDGVQISGLQVGELGARIFVTVVNAPAGARLDAWIDFNGDGSWGGASEQIANNRLVNNGQNTIRFDVPATAKSGTTFARFRISTAGNLGVKGAAVDGEVEDYAVTIDPPVNGGGEFSGERNIGAMVDAPISVVAADLDGDGDMDLVSASANDDKVAWHENNGNEVFTSHTISTEGDFARTVIVVDLDGDGDMDVVAGSELDGEINWYENNGSQVFTRHEVTATGMKAPAVKQVVAADMDGDGDMDLLSAHGSRVAWYENNGSQVFTQRLLPSAAIGLLGVSAADVDGDGDMDVSYVASTLSDNRVGWYENNGSQTFTARTISAAAFGARAITTVDLDKDGDLDFLVGAGSITPLIWFENNGDQLFTARGVFANFTDVWNVSFADIDGDGDIDILTASNNNNLIALLVNNGSQEFTRRDLSTTALSGRSVSAADIDGDGDLDVVAASSGDDSIVWFRQTTPGDFNGDGAVGGADLTLWRGDFGIDAGSDADHDGDSDGADFLIWQRNLRAAPGAPVAVVAAVEDGADSDVAAAAMAPDAAAGQDWFLTAEMFGGAAEATPVAVVDHAREETGASPAATDAALALFAGSGAMSSSTARRLSSSDHDAGAVEDDLWSEWSMLVDSL